MDQREKDIQTVARALIEGFEDKTLHWDEPICRYCKVGGFEIAIDESDWETKFYHESDCPVLVAKDLLVEGNS